MLPVRSVFRMFFVHIGSLGDGLGWPTWTSTSAGPEPLAGISATHVTAKSRAGDHRRPLPL